MAPGTVESSDGYPCYAAIGVGVYMTHGALVTAIIALALWPLVAAITRSGTSAAGRGGGHLSSKRLTRHYGVDADAVA